MKQYEYKFEVNVGQPFGIDDTEDQEERELNKLGEQGWELIAVSRCGKDFSYLGYWFKRERNPK